MEKVTIKRVYRDEKKNAKGAYTMTSIYTVEYPDRRMSSFQNGLGRLNAGDQIDVEIVQKGDFYNFKAVQVKEGKTTSVDLSGFEARLKKLEDVVYSNGLEGEFEDKVADPNA